MPETRILLVRDCESPDLGENAKVAVSVLQDDGWQASIVGITGSVHLHCVPFVLDDQLSERESRITAELERIDKREEKLAADLKRVDQLGLQVEAQGRRVLIEMVAVGVIILAHWSYNLLRSRDVSADLVVVIALAALGGWYRTERKAGR